MCFFSEILKDLFFLMTLMTSLNDRQNILLACKKSLKKSSGEHTVTSMLKISQVSLNVSLFSMVF